MSRDNEMYDIDPVWGLPRKSVRCGGCGSRYGSYKRKVCSMCGECSKCCSCKEDEKNHVDASVFIQKYLDC